MSHLCVTRRGVLVLLVAVTAVTAFSPQVEARPFTVTDDVEFAHFGGLYTSTIAALTFAPDRRWLVVNTERGRLDLNRPESTLRIYRVEDIRRFLLRSDDDGGSPPVPFWTMVRSTYESGPIVTHVRWLADSSAFAFLEKTSAGNSQLLMADLRTKTVYALSGEAQSVSAFDIRDREHYVYAVEASKGGPETLPTHEEGAIVGTGRPLLELLSTLFHVPPAAWLVDRCELWAVVNGKRVRVTEHASGRPIFVFSEGQQKLALSPRSDSIVTVLPVPAVPSWWEHAYPPPFPAFPYKIKSGQQDTDATTAQQFVSQYVQIDIDSGVVHSLTDAPTSNASGWWSNAPPSWSRDGRAVVLPGTFLRAPTGAPSRPCIVVVEFVSNTTTCVTQLKAQTASGYEDGYFIPKDVYFQSRDRGQITIELYHADGSDGFVAYRRTFGRSWIRIEPATTAEQDDLEVGIRQGLNEPPVLVATDTHTNVSRTILDPNPQLREIDLGAATSYTWADGSGRNSTGGLYKPPHFESGRRYPLVIQTHGFVPTEFRPPGIFPTAFAARELAASDILVLQVSDCPYSIVADEGSCNERAYESAATALIAEGLVDAERIGIVGFSRTCFFVMRTLVAGSLRLRAASITDGLMADYFQYLSLVDVRENALTAEADAMIGARPFGDGLEQWLKRSPLFSVDRVSAPLQVVSAERTGLSLMWGPYAALRHLQKPVDLTLLNSAEHLLTNPAARLASQGGTVDWFRFWLQGYEDPAQTKVEQYRRWENLCDMQITQHPDQAAFCVRSKTH